MSKSSFDVSIDNDGNVVIQQTTVMPPEEYLQQAGQIYQFQIGMKGSPASDALKLITGKGLGIE